MGPNLIATPALFLAEENEEELRHEVKKKHVLFQDVYTAPPSISVENRKYQWQIVWRNVLAFAYLHIFGLYGLYLFLFVCKRATFWWTLAVSILASQGITAGAHRLWAHRSYKAKLPLRIILMILQTTAFQNHIYEWVRDHRVHHKFTETDADPHNAKRGFFFSHIGWLMLKKHKDVTIKGKTVDMSDLEEDIVVRFQRACYLILMPIFCFGIPSLIPWYFFEEKIWVSWYVASIFRYSLSLNFTWLVNSAAHIWGSKPYEKSIAPTQNSLVAFLAFGEGWHNYHHVFPWDYKADELGNYRLNLTTMFIDFFAKVGWAYDLKTVSVDMIEKRAKRTGDGSRVCVKECAHEISEEFNHQGEIWGWGDKDMLDEDIKDVKVFNRLKEH